MILCSFDYPPRDGGISRLCAEITEGYRRRGARVRVLTQEAVETGPKAPDVPETRLTPARPRREWDAFRSLRSLGPGLRLCGTWYPEGVLAMLSGAPRYVVLAHGSELLPTTARWRRGVWRRLQNRVLSRAGLVIANSEYTRSLALESAPDCRAVAIPLPVDHRRFTPGDRDRAKRAFGVSGRHVLGSVSRVHDYKGHDVVLKALAALPAPEREGYLYLVAGRGPALPGLQEKARSLGIGHLVRWLGYVAEADLPDFYRACDVFVLCTREAREEREVEGFGLVFLEAQACGTPVIGTRSGGIPDAVAHGDGGWLIPQDDVPALAERIAKLGHDPESYRSAGSAARARVERECTVDHYMDRFESALNAEGLSVD